jgi:hypothetical protein
MSSTNKTSLGLNMWEASDKPVRQDFVNDNVIINEKITKLNSDLGNKLNNTGGTLTGNLVMQKEVPIYEMRVNSTLSGRIQKNAGGGADYGTEIVDVAGNVTTTLVITNGKLRLGKRVDGVIVGAVDIASIP